MHFRLWRRWWWPCFGASLVTIASDGLQVSNRAPRPEEIGYRPADGATAPLNPPSWIWLHETNAVRYDIQWARDAAFAEPVTVEGFRWNTYTHHEPLAPGTYHSGRDSRGRDVARLRGEQVLRRLPGLVR